MKLDGWHRLWIVTCAIYLVVLGMLVAPDWPDPDDISRESVYKDLGPDSRKVIPAPKPPRDIGPDLEKFRKANPKASFAEMLEKARELFMEGGSPTARSATTETLGDQLARGKAAFMANRDLVFFSADSSQEDRRKAATEYRRIVRNQLLKKRGGFLLSTGLWWLIPCLLVYVSGLSAAWIYRGFKGT
jgi:hypothetical protein